MHFIYAAYSTPRVRARGWEWEGREWGAAPVIPSLIAPITPGHSFFLSEEENIFICNMVNRREELEESSCFKVLKVLYGVVAVLEWIGTGVQKLLCCISGY